MTRSGVQSSPAAPSLWIGNPKIECESAFRLGGALGPLWGALGLSGMHLRDANVASVARYSHLANDTLMAATEAGAAKRKVD